VQIEKTSKALASPAAANEFRDSVAFVHQSASGTTFRSRMFSPRQHLGGGICVAGRDRCSAHIDSARPDAVSGAGLPRPLPDRTAMPMESYSAMDGTVK
jgi:hypothetical protein